MVKGHQQKRIGRTPILFCCIKYKWCYHVRVEIEKSVVFRKRISAKTTVFSAFKSVNQVDKSNDTLTLSAAGARSYSHIVKVSYYARNSFKVLVKIVGTIENRS